MIIRISGAPAEPPGHICRSIYTRMYVCWSRSPLVLFPGMHNALVEASLHCQWRIGKVPPISDRRHFSGRDVCRRFLKNVLTRAIVPGEGGRGRGGMRGPRKISRKFFTQSLRTHLYISRGKYLRIILGDCPRVLDIKYGSIGLQVKLYWGTDLCAVEEYPLTVLYSRARGGVSLVLISP